jgi:hypothetical protein
VKEIWFNFKQWVYEAIESSVPHKFLRNIQDNELYNREVITLNLKVKKHIIKGNYESNNYRN